MVRRQTKYESHVQYINYGKLRKRKETNGKETQDPKQRKRTNTHTAVSPDAREDLAVAAQRIYLDMQQPKPELLLQYKTTTHSAAISPFHPSYVVSMSHRV